MDASSWPTPFEPGSAEEHQFLVQHSRRVAIALPEAPKRRKPPSPDRFLTVNYLGLFDLACRIGHYGPAMLVALESLRRFVVTASELRLSATRLEEMHLSPKQGRAATERLATVPDLFAVFDRGRGRCTAIMPTEKGVSTLRYRYQKK